MSHVMGDRLSEPPNANILSGTNLCPIYIASGMAFFSFVNYLTRYLVPESLSKSNQSRWKWRNVLTSFIHSLITGTWASWSFYVDPTIRNDMIYSFSVSIHVLVSVSIGYFIYDFFDMYLHHKKRSTYELLLHHFMVILCYVVAATTRTYVSYAALSLVVEINSIFLHARQLLIIDGVTKQTPVYRSISLLNLSTFVLFRILLLGWMTRWLTLHRDDVPIIFFTIGSLGLAIMVVMSIILFYRVLQADLLNGENTIIYMTTNENGLTENGTVNGFRSLDKMLSRSISEDSKRL